MNLNSRLKPGQEYQWSMVVSVTTAIQEHWGTYVARPGETAKDVMESTRKSCARQMGAAEHAVKVVKFSLAETR